MNDQLTTSQQPLLLSVRQTSRLLGIATSHAYEMCRLGVIPSIRIGKSVRVPRKQLEQWIEAQTSTSVQ